MDIILGASLAGLSAAHTLLDGGRDPLLIDGSAKPLIKVCGEFLSDRAIPLIHSWDSPPTVTIRQGYCYLKGRPFPISFSAPCAGVNRLELEQHLLSRFHLKGGKSLIPCVVKQIHTGKVLGVELGDGTFLKADHLIVSMGRFQGGERALSPVYLGVKNHFEVPIAPAELHLACFKQGYIGLSPISRERVVVSCLTRWREGVSTSLDPYLDQVPSLKALLKGGKRVFENDVTAVVGDFGVKKTPAREGCYFVGDAKGTMAPILGEGMTHALASGKLAAIHLMNHDWQGYERAWREAFLGRMRWSVMLNQIALSVTAQTVFSPIAAIRPPILSSLYKRYIPQ